MASPCLSFVNLKTRSRTKRNVLDDEVEDIALTSVASGDISCFPQFEDDPSSSMIISKRLSRDA
jgi:hypothetical protein